MNLIKNLLTFFAKVIKGTIRSRIKLAVFLIIVALTVFLGWKFFSGRTKQVQYQTAKVEKGILITSVSASGTVTTSNNQEVTTQASGVVKEMYIEDGQDVTKGQKIAEIELDLVGTQRNAAAYSSYLNAVKSLNSAQNNYRSTQASLEVVYDEIKGHESDETLAMKEKRTKAEVANDNAYDGVTTAQAQLNSAALSYSQTSPTITAPSFGLIKLSVAKGSQISAGSSSDASNQRLATITTDGMPVISVNVSEIDVSKVKTGQKATITFDSIEDKTFTGKVLAVDNLGTSANSVVTYTTLIQLDTNSAQILPNMAVTVEIITNIKTDVITVPTTAITTTNNQSTLQVKKDNKITTVQVEIGSTNDSQTEIASGLNVGDEVVTATITTETTQSQNSTTSPFSGLGGTSRSSSNKSSSSGLQGGGPPAGGF